MNFGGRARAGRLDGATDMLYYICNTVLIHLQAASGVPLYRQVYQQLKERIVSGRLAANEQLPSVRELSEQLGINPLTVTKVYQLLRQEGLVELQWGRGTYVTGSARPRSLAERRRLIAPAVRQLVAEAQHLQLSGPELHLLIDEHLEQVARA